MNQSASRKDIDEVIGILQDFMKQVGDEFGNVHTDFVEVKRRLDEQDKKYDRLITSLQLMGLSPE